MFVLDIFRVVVSGTRRVWGLGFRV